MRAIAIKENEGPTAVSHKEDNAKLITYFQEILPDYDEERVYASDIKKLLNWYNILQGKGLVSKVEPADAPVENAEAIKEQVVKDVKQKNEAKSKTKK